MNTLEYRENVRNKVLGRMEKLRIPNFIVEEFLELEVFYSIKFLKKMLAWTSYEFDLWYESHNNYYTCNY